MTYVAAIMAYQWRSIVSGVNGSVNGSGVSVSARNSGIRNQREMTGMVA